MNSKICVAFLLFLPFFIAAQNSKKADSLLGIIHAAKPDSSKVRAYCHLCAEFLKSDTAKSLQYGNVGTNIARRIGFYPGLAHCLANIAFLYESKSDYSQALTYFMRSLEARKKTSDKWRTADCLRNIGNVCLKMSKYDEAIKNYFESQKYFEELNDYRELATTLGSIAGVYYINENLDNAIRYAEEALKMAENINDSAYLSFGHSNVGLMYSEKKDYHKGLLHLREALKLNTRRKDTVAVEQNYVNMGLLFYRQKKYSEALDYYEKALPLTRKVDKENIALVLNNIGEIYLVNKNYRKAIVYCGQSLEIARQNSANEDIKDAALNLAKAYSGIRDFTSAYENLFVYSSIKDSLFKNERQKTIAEMQAKYDVDKKEKENQLLNQKLDLQKLHTEQQRTIIYSVSAIAILLLFFAFFIFRGYRQKQKANRIIAYQKKIVEEKNKDITDSINYARRIQQAILPDAGEFLRLFPGSFILFRPKDIVSGDFYWISNKGETLFIAAADCTGHGVPGGFMSTLCNSLLNEVVNEKNIAEPSDILDLLRIKIISALKQKGEAGENKDGMDICLCGIKGDELVYAAANNPLWMVRDKKLMEFPADKQPVGISGYEITQFSQHKIMLNKNDCIYIFTDGYADQFGGPKGKKFKYKQLGELLVAIHSKSMEEQKNILNETLEKWQGSLEQVDDILIIGIRV